MSDAKDKRPQDVIKDLPFGQEDLAQQKGQSSLGQKIVALSLRASFSGTKYSNASYCYFLSDYCVYRCDHKKADSLSRISHCF